MLGWYPFWEGISERKYSDKELEELNNQSKKYEFDGKKYSEYEASQRMRQIERSIRQTKRELASKLTDGIERSLLRGERPDVWARNLRGFIKDTVNGSIKAAERLA